MNAEPLHLALLIFVVAPAVVLGAAAFVATVSEPTASPTVNPTTGREQDDDA